MLQSGEGSGITWYVCDLRFESDTKMGKEVRERERERARERDSSLARSLALSLSRSPSLALSLSLHRSWVQKHAVSPPHRRYLFTKFEQTGCLLPNCTNFPFKFGLHRSPLTMVLTETRCKCSLFTFVPGTVNPPWRCASLDTTLTVSIYANGLH